MRTSRGLNAREHHMRRSSRVKRERYAVGMILNTYPPPALPCVVVLQREAPAARPLDDDNLQGALKAVRDEVARWLGVDDSSDLITWVYNQQRAPQWAVTIMAQADDDSGDSDAKQEPEEAPGAPTGEGEREAATGLRDLRRQGVGENKVRLSGAVPRLLQGPTNGNRH
jgi:hypothetical protein